MSYPVHRVTHRGQRSGAQLGDPGARRGRQHHRDTRPRSIAWCSRGSKCYTYTRGGAVLAFSTLVSQPTERKAPAAAPARLGYPGQGRALALSPDHPRRTGLATPPTPTRRRPPRGARRKPPGPPADELKKSPQPDDAPTHTALTPRNSGPGRLSHVPTDHVWPFESVAYASCEKAISRQIRGGAPAGTARIPGARGTRPGPLHGISKEAC